MAREPNGVEKKLGYVAKIRDPVDPTQFKPIYIAPDATDKVQGDVYLSDDIDNSADAATGMTAATPKAVKEAIKQGNNKLDKIAYAAQTVNSPVTFKDNVKTEAQFIGNLQGNADSATEANKLKTARSIGVKAGPNATLVTAAFDGTKSISLTLPNLDATALKGIVPIANLPKGALERLIHVADEAARFALTANDVQLGDTVIQDDTQVMYMVVDEANLNNALGYQEYKAGTAMRALTADAVEWDNVLNKVYASADTDGIIDSELWSLLDNMFGDGDGAELKGNASSATKIKNPFTLGLEGDVVGDISLDCSEDAAIATTISDQAVTLDKLDINIGTLYIGPDMPIDPHIKFWIKTEEAIDVPVKLILFLNGSAADPKVPLTNTIDTYSLTANALMSSDVTVENYNNVIWSIVEARNEKDAIVNSDLLINFNETDSTFTVKENIAGSIKFRCMVKDYAVFTDMQITLSTIPIVEPEPEPSEPDSPAEPGRDEESDTE